MLSKKIQILLFATIIFQCCARTPSYGKTPNKVTKQELAALENQLRQLKDDHESPFTPYTRSERPFGDFANSSAALSRSASSADPEETVVGLAPKNQRRGSSSSALSRSSGASSAGETRPGSSVAGGKNRGDELSRASAADLEKATTTVELSESDQELLKQNRALEENLKPIDTTETRTLPAVAPISYAESEPGIQRSRNTLQLPAVEAFRDLETEKATRNRRPDNSSTKNAQEIEELSVLQTKVRELEEQSNKNDTQPTETTETRKQRAPAPTPMGRYIEKDGQPVPMYLDEIRNNPENIELPREANETPNRIFRNF